jgi:hypothetical protein
MYQGKNNIGLNIDNFVNTLNYNNTMMREKVTLFVSYMEFFHKLHHKYFKRFTTKLQLMYSQITHDIKFDDSEETHKTKNQDMIHTLENDEIDNRIVKEVKASINDSTDASSEEAELRSISVDSGDFNTVEVMNSAFTDGKVHPDIVVEDEVRLVLDEIIDHIASTVSNETQ